MAKVVITTAGHTVEIDATEDLEAVAVRALQIWTATRDPKLDRAYGAGFAQAEQVFGGQESPDDRRLGTAGRGPGGMAPLGANAGQG